MSGSPSGNYSPPGWDLPDRVPVASIGDDPSVVSIQDGDHCIAVLLQNTSGVPPEELLASLEAFREADDWLEAYCYLLDRREIFDTDARVLLEVQASQRSEPSLPSRRGPISGCWSAPRRSGSSRPSPRPIRLRPPEFAQLSAPPVRSGPSCCDSMG
jgi:hypothetical protein